MKFLKNLICNRVHCTALIICVAMVVGILLAAFSFRPEAESYTVSSDVGYYSETTYYLTENAYNKFLKEQKAELQANAPSQNTRKASCSLTSPAEYNMNGYEFVSATVQNVWVDETIDSEGRVVDSKLMTKAEIDAYNQISTQKQSTTTVSNNSVNTYSSSADELGRDETSKYRLTIQLIALYDDTNNVYYAVGYATWKSELVWFWQGEEAAEEGYPDLMSITWGGSKTIEATSYSISGYYYNDNPVTFTKLKSDSYEGYVWEFHEKTGFLGKEMENALAAILLSPTENIGKSTNIKLTYVHTYDETDITEADISFEVGYNSNNVLDASAAVQLKLETTTNTWSIEIDVPGIVY